MQIKRFALWAAWLFVGFLGVSLGAPAAVDEPGFVRTSPDKIQWQESPTLPGIQGAVLVGDPTKPGLYIVRIKFAPGVMSRPHFHPDDRYIVVLQGMWYAGTGDTFDPRKAVAMKPGSFMKDPAQGHHFDGSRNEQVIIQITGTGPTGTTYLHPADGFTGRWH